MIRSTNAVWKDMPQPAIVREPGIYDGIPNDVYHADPVLGGSLSQSGAKMLLPPSAPAKYDEQRRNPTASTRAQNLGSAAHAVVLDDGPRPFLIDAADYRTKDAKAARDQALADGLTPVLPAELETVMRMAEAILAHPLASQLLGVPGKAEQSAFWHDAEFDVWRRARFDFLPDPEHHGRPRLLVPDYKTTKAAHPDQFARSVADFGYHMQADWYLSALVALGYDPDAVFLFIAQETTPPYLVTVGQLDDDALQIGRHLNRKALRIFAQCRESGVWPGYSDGVETLALPYWYVNNHSEAFQ